MPGVGASVWAYLITSFSYFSARKKYFFFQCILKCIIQLVFWIERICWIERTSNLKTVSKLNFCHSSTITRLSKRKQADFLFYTLCLSSTLPSAACLFILSPFLSYLSYLSSLFLSVPFLSLNNLFWNISHFNF